MQTKRYTQNDLKEAAQQIEAGELVAFPTETVFGLGADATNDTAVKKIYQAKGRPSDNPLIVHIATICDAQKFVKSIPPQARQLMDAFWPGPLTLILQSSGIAAPTVTAGLDTVGIRMPAHPVALAFIRACHVGLAAPSANLSGRPSPTMAQHVYDDLQGKIAGIIEADDLEVGVESTVIDITSDRPTILRPGGITQEAIEAVIGPIRGFEENQNMTKGPKAPGMKYQHYAPNVPVWMVEDFDQALREFSDKKIGLLAKEEIISRYQNEPTLMASVSLGKAADIESANATFYKGLRTLEQAAVDVILAQVFPAKGAGVAYMNRLSKASGGKIIK
ncbi:L-threonylcarbamoyladenylate synthase [Allofustis seminis]|uniref:L-threonylcarbamoyladenylate synthase n=1 Tax=Allofustis seminis TaxID=166939 RepID=UPI000373ED59|nr:L-threonylcarbamoyladenylate synthase [Allofustis seminis]